MEVGASNTGSVPPYVGQVAAITQFFAPFSLVWQKLGQREREQAELAASYLAYLGVWTTRSFSPGQVVYLGTELWTTVSLDSRTVHTQGFLDTSTTVFRGSWSRAIVGSPGGYVPAFLGGTTTEFVAGSTPETLDQGE